MLSVVIPTRNRRAVLMETLSRVLGQDPPPGGFEVVVVDNGSTDDTMKLLGRLAAGSPRLRAISERVRGPAAARNSGAAAATGDMLLFLGDDTEPASDDLLSRHVALHRARPAPEYAVLGRVVWNERQPVTPLMRWLDEGFQFAFELLEPGLVDPAAYFYTSQVSLKKEMFDAVGGFNTRFPYAAAEDIEIGVRLASSGLVLDYHPELVVLHSHPGDLERWLERMRLVGRSAALFEELHADGASPTLTMPKGFRYACVRAASPAFAVLRLRAAPSWLQRLRWRVLFHAAYARGYREGPPDEPSSEPEAGPATGASPPAETSRVASG